MTAPPRPNPLLIDIDHPHAFANERAAARVVADLLARGSAAEIGSQRSRRLYAGEVIDHSRTEFFELGERALQHGSFAPVGPFRERMS